MDHIIQTQIEKLRCVELMGFQGVSLEDERKLFEQLKQSVGGIETMKQYLVILPGIRPLAAVEAVEAGEVPEGMTTYTIPEDEYVIFRFEKQYIGEFWDKVCTEENRAKYSIDLSKPRYEIFTPELQTSGIVERYIPR